MPFTLLEFKQTKNCMANNKSEHILNTSSNLLGFCLVVLTSLKISKYSAMSIIDEMTGVGTIFLIASSIFSFLSIRTAKEHLSVRYEKIAENIFIVALIFVFLITFMVGFLYNFLTGKLRALKISKF